MKKILTICFVVAGSAYFFAPSASADMGCYYKEKSCWFSGGKTKCSGSGSDCGHESPCR